MHRPITLLLGILLTLPALAAVEVGDTRFSVDRGFYSSSQSVAITCSTADAAIRYTRDGTLPSATHGMLYEGPVSISTTTVLRAIAYDPAGVMTPSNIDTHTYLFVDDVYDQGDPAGYPVETRGEKRGTMRYDYRMDSDGGSRSQVVAGLLALPSLSLSAPPEFIFDSGSGRWPKGGPIIDNETTVSVEMLYPDETTANWASSAGIEHHSRWHNPKESVRMNFRDLHGDGRLDADLMRSAVFHAEGATTHFDKLILRAGGNESFLPNNANEGSREEVWGRNCTYVRDQWMRDTALSMNGTGAPRGIFVHLYINGLYFGLYNVTERPDAFHAAEYWGGDKDDYYARSHSGANNGSSSVNYDAATNPATYDDVQRLVDQVNVIDYMLLNWFVSMGDWPGNNWWAHIRNEPVAGPFRMQVWDGEFCWGLASYAPSIQAPRIKSGGAFGTIWSTAKGHPDFRMLLADRIYQHCFNGGALTDTANRARWAALTGAIEEAIRPEIRRWANNGVNGQTRTYGMWSEQVARVDAMMDGQVDRFLATMSDYWPATAAPLFKDGVSIITASETTVAVDFALTIARDSGSGTIYYTLDGDDPRDPGGVIHSDAIDAGASADISLATNSLVRARVLDGDEWSPLREVLFIVSDGSTPPLVINEVLSHTDWPQVDAIEIHNPTDRAVDVGLWWLSDDKNRPRKYRLPVGASIPAEGYLVVLEDDDANPDDNDDLPPEYFGQAFGLSSRGDEAYLWSPDLTYGHGFSYGAAANGVSFARYVTDDGTERFPASQRNTLGSVNSGPLVGPVVIDEIHYHPLDGDDEFIALTNISEATVDLFDPANPTNTWKVEGVSFSFPEGVAIPPAGRVMLVRDTTTAADFRARHLIDATMPIFIYDGKLDNGGEAVILQRPDAPDLVDGHISAIDVDRVRYDDVAPWPTMADGGGPSLARIDATAFGDEASNWRLGVTSDSLRIISIRATDRSGDRLLLDPAIEGLPDTLPSETDGTYFFEGLDPRRQYQIDLLGLSGPKGISRLLSPAIMQR